MSWPLISATYFTTWWIVLFVTLPFGVRSQQEAGEKAAPGVDPGAPVAPLLLKKALATTILSALVVAALDFYVVHWG